MTIVERFLRLEMPVEQCVIIGSGVRDALNLRRSGDIDVVVSDELFSRLSGDGRWRAEVRHDETVLLMEDVELWRSWGSDGVPNFDDLFGSSIEVEGVHFADPAYVLEQKRKSLREKDVQDIRLLEEYLSHAAK